MQQGLREVDRRGYMWACEQRTWAWGAEALSPPLAHVGPKKKAKQRAGRGGSHEKIPASGYLLTREIRTKMVIVS